MAQEQNNDGAGELSIDQLVDQLSEGQEKEEETLNLETEKPEEEEEEGEKKSVEEDIEDELKEPDESKLQLTTPVRRREILAKYPQLFKDFPYLESAYYREQQFTEMFPTIPDAQEAKEKASVMDNFENHIMEKGDLGVVLSTIKEENVDSFHRVVDNLLPALKQVDENAYFSIIGNITKSTILSMIQEARNQGENGQPLQAAAHILNQFVFGTTQFQPPQRLHKEEKPDGREDGIKKRENELIQQRFESARDDLQGKVDNVLKATIDQNIDKKGQMTPYVKRNASREAFEMLENQLSNDSRFRTVITKLWERAAAKNFDKPSMEAIRSACLSKAKTLLPTVIQKARTDALKGLGKRVSEGDEESPNRNPLPAGRSTSSNSGKKSNEIPRGMKTIDFLMQD